MSKRTVQINASSLSLSEPFTMLWAQRKFSSLNASGIKEESSKARWDILDDDDRRGSQTWPQRLGINCRRGVPKSLEFPDIEDGTASRSLISKN